jgi:myo-inositol-1(or 4)-monophosphatase
MAYLPFIKKALARASQIARQSQGKVSVTIKPEDNSQVLTDADLTIGKYIVGQIQRHFPKHNIIDEEAGVIDNNSAFTWVVDPIDGTSNFAAGLPHYGIMIGVLHQDKPFAGGVSLPAFQEIYLAQQGKGATGNGKKITVTKETKLLSALVAYLIDGHPDNPQTTLGETKILARVILGCRNLRITNAVYDPIMVAKGVYGGALCQTSKIWDNIAQQIILEEAGAIYTDFWGKPMDYSQPLVKAKKKANFTFCTGSLKLHRQLQNIIHT